MPIPPPGLSEEYYSLSQSGVKNSFCVGNESHRTPHRACYNLRMDWRHCICCTCISPCRGITRHGGSRFVSPNSSSFFNPSFFYHSQIKPANNDTGSRSLSLSKAKAGGANRFGFDGSAKLTNLRLSRRFTTVLADTYTVKSVNHKAEKFENQLLSFML
jgi:hypothetical protein